MFLLMYKFPDEELIIHFLSCNPLLASQQILQTCCLSSLFLFLSSSESRLASVHIYPSLMGASYKNIYIYLHTLLCRTGAKKTFSDTDSHFLTYINTRFQPLATLQQRMVSVLPVPVVKRSPCEVCQYCKTFQHCSTAFRYS